MLGDQLAELQRRAFEALGAPHRGLEVGNGGRAVAVAEDDVDDVDPLVGEVSWKGGLCLWEITHGEAYLEFYRSISREAEVETMYRHSRKYHKTV